ncbi:MAG: ribulose-phosphate 3-epimerase [Lachnospiraceae bacterium]|nr:ribulose-phosphate 3-epimerase [Lachnospiraceae bacterium]MBQ5376487.1 ribulose-phosphate 3-epimerase [Lachnospiraceae bacterium]MBR1849293.1 ribulose-phosphate 3-epimerase [Lachnospiraceae bacterium]
MLNIAPSILSADFTKLGEQVALVQESGLKLLHIDVMDGVFVPNISYGSPVIQSLRPLTDLTFDVHLMITEPSRILQNFIDDGADQITVHAEACTHLHRTVGQIKEAGLKAAVALNPATPLSALDYVLDDLDMVLIMTVNPGFGGQTFIPQMMQKITALRKEIERRGLATDIQVDGGVDASNISAIKKAGANVFVAGSAVFKGDILQNIAALQTALDK